MFSFIFILNWLTYLGVVFQRGVKSGNPEFADAIAAWTFQESLTIQVENATHYLTSDKSGKQRDRYTTNDIVVRPLLTLIFDSTLTFSQTFTMKLTSWNPYNNIRTPFGGLTDVQLEFTMLDPHIRTELKPVAGQPGTYTATFRVPDRHGVFKFIVDYRRKGYVLVSQHYKQEQNIS